jgi:hypothetical protein
VFLTACAAESASAAGIALEMVDAACEKAGWNAGPFELADKLGVGAMRALLVEYTVICQRDGRPIGNGLRAAALVVNALNDPASSCKKFWSFSSKGRKMQPCPGIGAVIHKAASELQLPRLPPASRTPHSVHLHVLLAASESCLSLLRRRAVPSPEVLDLLLVAAGYPANQGGVLECARNTVALADYEAMVLSAGADALDSVSWRDTYHDVFEWKIMTDRPCVTRCQSVSALSCRPPAAERAGHTMQ